MSGGAEERPFDSWLEALERRHMAELTFAEVRRALQALSSLYVERRSNLPGGAALDGAGKRAAFALFYGPLHFLLVDEVVRALTAGTRAPARILDLGCGTGVAGAAWALACGSSPSLTGVDRNPWALEEARWTYRTLGVRGRTRQGDVPTFPLAGSDAVIAAFTVNELAPPARETLLRKMLTVARSGVQFLVIEPVAHGAAPWWDDWSKAVCAAGGRDDLWRFPVVLPGILRSLDHAAGLDHAELTGRSLWLGPYGA